MELINKRVQYSVSNSSENYKVLGDLSIQDDNRIQYLGLTVYNNSEEYCGECSYSETSDNKITKNVSNISREALSEVIDLLDTTISAIKAVIE